MNCKEKICELLKAVMDISLDLRTRKFMLKFKKDVESGKMNDDIALAD